MDLNLEHSFSYSIIDYMLTSQFNKDNSQSQFNSHYIYKATWAILKMFHPNVLRHMVYEINEPPGSGSSESSLSTESKKPFSP